eukprot:jgi/Hompol1/1515/HPOL_003951-RA
MSGVAVDDEVMTSFLEMQRQRLYAFIIFKIAEDGESIVVDKKMSTAESLKLGTEATYDAFVASMPRDNGRYGLFELEYQEGDEGLRNKLVLILWNPSEGKIRSRMLYASSMAAVRQRLNGFHSEVQCTDASEIAFESVFAEIAPKTATPIIKAPAPAEE